MTPRQRSYVNIASPSRSKANGVTLRALKIEITCQNYVIRSKIKSLGIYNITSAIVMDLTPEEPPSFKFELTTLLLVAVGTELFGPNRDDAFDLSHK